MAVHTVGLPSGDCDQALFADCVPAGENLPGISAGSKKLDKCP